MNIADELSIQLYSLRYYGDLAAQLAALSKLGFRRVELTGAHLDNPEATKSLLDEHGMTAPTAHVPMQVLRSRFDEVAEQVRIIGVKELYMPALPDDERSMSADDWHRTGVELGYMASRIEAHGLKLGYHNHDWELIPLPDGSTPLVHLFAGAEDSPLTFEADLAWIVRGKGDPLDIMKSLQSRLTAVHVKDLAPAGTNLEEDGWADIGAGTLDWPHLWREAQALGAKWMILEHDKPTDPIRFAEASRAFLLQNAA
jgi:sugar phosphate isomerase/epimerase